MSKYTFIDTTFAPKTTRAVMGAIFVSVSALAVVFEGIYVIVWGMAYLGIAVACAMFNVSVFLTESGEVCVKVCGLPMFSEQVNGIESIARLWSVEGSWSVRMLFGLYLQGGNGLWAAAGVPVVKISTGKRYIIVTMEDYRGLAREVANMTGRCYLDIIKE